MSRLTRLTSLLSPASLGFTQNISNIIPFQATGSLDGCSAGTEYNAEGTISINELTIVVPKNLIVQFPVVYAPFPKLCSAGAGGFETTVTVAARFGLEGGQGYTSSIDNGVIEIAGGPKVSAQPYFIMNTENPSVSSFSGSPVCILHSGKAETCKESNCPAGQTNFNTPDPLVMVPLKAGDFVEMHYEFTIVAAILLFTTVRYDALTNGTEILY